MRQNKLIKTMKFRQTIITSNTKTSEDAMQLSECSTILIKFIFETTGSFTKDFDSKQNFQNNFRIPECHSLFYKKQQPNADSTSMRLE